MQGWNKDSRSGGGDGEGRGGGEGEGDQLIFNPCLIQIRKEKRTTEKTVAKRKKKRLEKVPKRDKETDSDTTN